MDADDDADRFWALPPGGAWEQHAREWDSRLVEKRGDRWPKPETDAAREALRVLRAPAHWWTPEDRHLAFRALRPVFDPVPLRRFAAVEALRALGGAATREAIVESVAAKHDRSTKQARRYLEYAAQRGQVVAPHPRCRRQLWRLARTDGRPLPPAELPAVAALRALGGAATQRDIIERAGIGQATASRQLERAATDGTVERPPAGTRGGVYRLA